MKRLGSLSMGKLTVLATLLAVVVLLFASGQQMFSAGPLNAQSRNKVELGGVTSHAEIRRCAACHASPWSRDTMASRCMECHFDVREQLDALGPMHGLLSDGQQCRSCHTEHKGATAALTDMTRFDHDCAAFKLTGKHGSVDCQSCHRNSTYKGTASDCASCHAEPRKHLGKFGTHCAECHTTTTWDGAAFPAAGTSFNHDLTGFKLTGAHQTLDCKSCHKTNEFKGTPQSCVACHAEPTKHLGKFGTACTECHSTKAWSGAVFNTTVTKFDHNTTAFKLTGKHQMVDCKSCHKTNNFKGTPQNCVSCHAEPAVPAVHKMHYGTDCARCHTTMGFTGATFKHTFPIDHGRRRSTTKSNTCANCHSDLAHSTAYTCYGCHEHEKTRIERRHARLKVDNLDLCAKCHGPGRRRERTDLGVEIAPFGLCLREDNSAGCPRFADVLLPREPTLPAFLRIEPTGRAPDSALDRLRSRREVSPSPLFDPDLFSPSRRSGVARCPSMTP
jgi:hypothetical protein